MTELNQVEKELNNTRLRIKQAIFEPYIQGSPDIVIERIEDGINEILDERDSLLINVFEELYTEIKTIKETIKKHYNEWEQHTCCKEERIPTNIR